jgi:iron complex outermembrane receptor protein
LSWTSASQALEVAAFVRNAADKRDILRYTTPSTVTRLQNIELSDPITYGLQVRYSFY